MAHLPVPAHQPFIGRQPFERDRPARMDATRGDADFSAKLGPLLSGGALSEEEIATLLCIEKSQAKAWLKRASETGLVEKLKKPVRFALGNQASLC